MLVPARCAVITRVIRTKACVGRTTDLSSAVMPDAGCALQFARPFEVGICLAEFLVERRWRGDRALACPRASRQKEHGPAPGSCSSVWLPRLDGSLSEYAPRPASNYSGAPAIATGTSVPVLGAGFAQVTVPRTLAPWASAWDSVTVSFSSSLGALRASFHEATLLTTP
jgi:hypothetical protein